jgi:hypothetical protein
MFARGPLSASKLTTDPHILAHVNIVGLDDRQPKLKIHVSELILGSYEYIPVASVTMHCMILPSVNCQSLAPWAQGVS